MGNSRKYPYLYHGQLFGIPRARGGSLNWNSEGMGGGGGSLNWNSEGMGGFFELEFRRHGGFPDLRFPEGTDKSVFIEKANFVDFTGS